MSKLADWAAQAEAKLDEWGRGAWIAAMVLGFILFWPVGLFLLGYMIWSGRMGCHKGKRGWRNRTRTTGNSAFDDYREETLRRLEDEQGAFEAFLTRLRQAKDKTEFDLFMEERRRGGSATTPEQTA